MYSRSMTLHTEDVAIQTHNYFRNQDNFTRYDIYKHIKSIYKEHDETLTNVTLEIIIYRVKVYEFAEFF
jgi:hypothetical protein